MCLCLSCRMCHTSAMSKERNAQKGIDFEVDTVLGLQIMHKMPVCPRGAAHTLTSARLQLTPSLLSAPGQISQTNIFQSQENSHTSISWNRRLAYSFELADKADWISINTTIQFPCQYFTLHILIHCFGSKHDISDDSHRQAEVLLGLFHQLGSHSITLHFVNYLRLRHNHPSKEPLSTLLTFTFRLLFCLYDDKKCESFLR